MVPERPLEAFADHQSILDTITIYVVIPNGHQRAQLHHSQALHELTEELWVTAICKQNRLWDALPPSTGTRMAATGWSTVRTMAP